jgi:hypothetical protein
LANLEGIDGFELVSVGDGAVERRRRFKTVCGAT